MVVLLAIVLFVYVGPMFYKTNQTNTNAILSSLANQPPSSQHPLGTDITGWDVLGRIMYGGKYSLTLGFLAGLITIVVGTAYGMISGFFGGATDAIMMRAIDAALSIPYLFLLVALVTVFGPTNTLLLLVIGLTGWWGNSRIIRGDALVIRDLEYSVASTSMGGTKLHVIRRHVFPNSISNIVTVGTFSVADAILALSALGFIGIGVQAPATDWGFMLFQGSSQLINGYWWESSPPRSCSSWCSCASTTSATRCATSSRCGCGSAEAQPSGAGPSLAPRDTGVRSGKWHAAVCRDPNARSSGSSTAQRSCARGQRVRNRQPDGGSAALGSSPPIVWPARALASSGSGIGTASSRPWV